MKSNFKTAALFANDGVDIIVLCRGETVSGKPFYAFVKIKPSRYSAFQRAQEGDRSFDMQDYGEILDFDYAQTPPQEVIDKMRAQYGGSI